MAWVEITSYSHMIRINVSSYMNTGEASVALSDQNVASTTWIHNQSTTLKIRGDNKA